MTREIGECFECVGETLIVVKADDCFGCFFEFQNCTKIGDQLGHCALSERSDGKEAQFRQVTKQSELKKRASNLFTVPIGEVIQIENEFFQVLPNIGCSFCDLVSNCLDESIRGCCGGTLRSDGIPVIFVNVEKLNK